MSSNISRLGTAPVFHPQTLEDDQQTLSKSVRNEMQSQDVGAMTPSNHESQDLPFEGPRYEPHSVYSGHGPQPHYYMATIYQSSHEQLSENVNQGSNLDNTIRSNGKVHHAVYHNATFNTNFRIQHNVRSNMFGSVGRHLSRSRSPLDVEEANCVSSNTRSELGEDEIVNSPEDDIQDGNRSGSPCRVDESSGLARKLPPTVESSTCFKYNSGFCSVIICFLFITRYSIIFAIGLLVILGIKSLMGYYADPENYP